MPAPAPCGDDPVGALLAHSDWDAQLHLTPDEHRRLSTARQQFTDTSRSEPVYGVTHGFGPLVGHRADPDPHAQGLGLIHHLAVGQGRPLPARVTRTMVWLRLRGMALGHSAVDPAIWNVLARQWNAGFTPVVPREGSLSASGDLVPLAHAALAAAGRGQEAWRRTAGKPRPAPSGQVLTSLGLEPVTWEARSALGFVNGSSACLARALHTHYDVAVLARAAAAASGRIVALLGACHDPYEDALSRVRNQPGQHTAAAWIRAELDPAAPPGADRPLQERYALRCAPQVLGAVLDQLAAQARVLVDEATGCSDNPVLVEGRLLHGGNFHAAPVGFVSESHTSCLHQVALLAERQLALLVDPRGNGGLPALLTPRPGAASGLAGVQIAATSHLARIRQLAHPAALTSLPTNLDNQDHVPMALNGANAAADVAERTWWILGSLLLAVNQAAHLLGAPPGGGLWARLRSRFAALDQDRPLADEVTAAAAEARAAFQSPRLTAAAAR